MHINLVSKLYASNLYAYWAFQQAQSAHQPQAGHQLSSHEKLQAEQLTHPPGLNEDENKAAKKAKTAMVGVEKIVEDKFQMLSKCMKGQIKKEKCEMLKFFTQQESNPKPDLPHVGILSEYKSFGGLYAVSSNSSSSSSSSSRESSIDEGLGKKQIGSSRDEGLAMVERTKRLIGTTCKAIAKPPSAIPKSTIKGRREEERLEAERLGIPLESSGSSAKDEWPPSPTPSPPPGNNDCAAEKVAPKKKKRAEKQGRDAHNPHGKPPDITITADRKYIDNRGTSSRPAPIGRGPLSTEGPQETPEDPRRQRRNRRGRSQ